MCHYKINKYRTTSHFTHIKVEGRAVRLDIGLDAAKYEIEVEKLSTMALDRIDKHGVVENILGTFIVLRDSVSVPLYRETKPFKTHFCTLVLKTVQEIWLTCSCSITSRNKTQGEKKQNYSPASTTVGLSSLLSLQEKTYKEIGKDRPHKIKPIWIEHENKGGLYYSFCKGIVYLEGIYVLQEHRRAGVGQKLIEKLYGEVLSLKQNGHKITTIDVHTNLNGQHLMDSLISKNIYSELVSANIIIGSTYQHYYFFFYEDEKNKFVQAKTNSKIHHNEWFVLSRINDTENTYKVTMKDSGIELINITLHDDLVHITEDYFLVKDGVNEILYITKG